MEKINQIIEMAKTGTHPACESCSRNPKKENTAFAQSCDEHFPPSKNGLVIIARDPGARAGGASHTQRLCPIHNHDKSAKITNSYLERITPKQPIYFLNAILHGYFDKKSKAKNDAERKSCKFILGEIIECLQPKVILALGLEALQSSMEILGKSEVVKPSLTEIIQRSFSYGQLSGVHLFAFPHPAYARVNLGKYGLKEMEAWGKVAEGINRVMANDFTHQIL